MVIFNILLISNNHYNILYSYKPLLFDTLNWFSVTINTLAITSNKFRYKLYLMKHGDSKKNRIKAKIKYML